MSKVNIQDLKTALVDATGCAIQHDGWPCNTCFHSSTVLTNQDWQAVLSVRGDYTGARAEFDNLPEDVEASLRKTLDHAEAVAEGDAKW